jgi:hypothetical protein
LGTTDFGLQKISFDYNQDAESRLFNNNLYGILPVGIYSGFSLAKLGDTKVSLSTGICFIQDSASQTGVRVETTELIANVTVSTSTPYVVLRFAWLDVQSNYMDVLSVAYDDILPDDLIVGRCIYGSADLQATFDYTRRSNFYLKSTQESRDYFRVYATEPISNQVNISSGVINTPAGNKVISGESAFPTGGFSNTVNGRIDLIYLDRDGAFQLLAGVDGVSPVAPEYGNRKVIAEIRRGASRTDVRGSDIFRVISSFDMLASPSDLLIQDSGNFYTSANVEAALQEIAGSTFTFKGVKTLQGSLSITATAGVTALTVQGASGQNIAVFKNSGGSNVATINSSGVLTLTTTPTIPITDSTGKYTTAQVNAALMQIAGGTMTLDGNKTFTNALTLSSTTASRALVTDASKKTVSSVVTATELAYLSGTTSAIQTQINTKTGNLILTKTFEASTGSFTIPTGVTSVLVWLNGAGGKGYQRGWGLRELPYPGGGGGSIIFAEIAVTAGQTISYNLAAPNAGTGVSSAIINGITYTVGNGGNATLSSGGSAGATISYGADSRRRFILTYQGLAGSPADIGNGGMAGWTGSDIIKQAHKFPFLVNMLNSVPTGGAGVPAENLGHSYTVRYNGTYGGGGGGSAYNEYKVSEGPYSYTATATVNAGNGSAAKLVIGLIS